MLTAVLLPGWGLALDLLWLAFLLLYLRSLPGAYHARFAYHVTKAWLWGSRPRRLLDCSEERFRVWPDDVDFNMVRPASPPPLAGLSIPALATPCCRTALPPCRPAAPVAVCPVVLAGADS